MGKICAPFSSAQVCVSRKASVRFELIPIPSSQRAPVALWGKISHGASGEWLWLRRFSLRNEWLCSRLLVVVRDEAFSHGSDAPERLPTMHG